jgi:hypothetical protein
MHFHSGCHMLYRHSILIQIILRKITLWRRKCWVTIISHWRFGKETLNSQSCPLQAKIYCNYYFTLKAAKRVTVHYSCNARTKVFKSNKGSHLRSKARSVSNCDMYLHNIKIITIACDTRASRVCQNEVHGIRYVETQCP